MSFNNFSNIQFQKTDDELFAEISYGNNRFYLSIERRGPNTVFVIKKQKTSGFKFFLDLRIEFENIKEVISTVEDLLNLLLLYNILEKSSEFSETDYFSAITVFKNSENLKQVHKKLIEKFSEISLRDPTENSPKKIAKDVMLLAIDYNKKSLDDVVSFITFSSNALEPEKFYVYNMIFDKKNTILIREVAGAKLDLKTLLIQSKLKDSFLKIKDTYYHKDVSRHFSVEILNDVFGENWNKKIVWHTNIELGVNKELAKADIKQIKNVILIFPQLLKDFSIFSYDSDTLNLIFSSVYYTIKDQKLNRVFDIANVQVSYRPLIYSVNC